MICTRSLLRRSAAPLLAALLFVPGAGEVHAAPPDSACPGVAVGTVKGVQIRSADVGTAPPDQIILIRSGASQPVQKGMPLCAGDHITVQGEATLVMSLAESVETSADITLYAFASVELTDPHSIFVRIGRMFAMLRGVFEARTTVARLGAKGTEFQVEVAETGIEVIQLEGELDFETLGSVATGAAPDSPAEQMLSSGLQSAFLSQEKFPPKKPTGPPVSLRRLSRLVFLPDRKTPPQIFGADEELVRKVVDANAGAILVTRPPEPSRSLMRNFSSNEQRARAYREARFRTIWSPEDTRYFQLLGNVYVDWAEAQKAVHSYGNAGKIEGAHRELAIYYNNLGNSYRLAGSPKEAESCFARALHEDPNFAFPYNGWGDVFLDLAQSEYDRGNVSQAHEFLGRAEQLYLKSLDGALWGKEGGQNRAIPLFHLGDLALLWAQLDAESAPADGIKLRLDEAGRYFQEALKEAPNYPFARVGLGRMWAARGHAAAKSENAEESAKYLEAARNEYRHVLERDPSFAPAHIAWGESYEQQGDWKAAAQYFRRATQADPGYPPAYYKSAVALQKLGDTALARNYFSAFLQVESPLLRNGNRAKEAKDSIGAPPPQKGSGESSTVTVPPVTGVSEDEAEDLLGHAGLQKGRVQFEHADAPRNTVVRQQPGAGAQVKPGTKVNLWRSSGPLKMTYVPNVVGLKTWQAALTLGFLALRMREQQVDSDAEKGKIVNQEPANGARVMQDTDVVVYVSSGSGRPDTDQVTVPEVVGHTTDQAKKEIERAGLVYQLGFSEAPEIFNIKIVKRQKPSSGSRVPRGTTVTVYLD